TTLGGAQDAFVTKLNSTGTALVYSTFLGGDGVDAGNSLAIDTAGNAYLTGSTGSPDFPTTAGVFQTASGGATDAFVTKVNPTGTAPLAYSTYLGGTGSDIGNGIVVDSSGNAYVTGSTGSPNFPTCPSASGASPCASTGTPLQDTRNGPDDAFVTKINGSGSALTYSTYLGGDFSDTGNSLAVDTATDPNAYVTGRTFSTNFPTGGGAFQTTRNGPDDAFVTKINGNGSALTYSTYLGGDGSDAGNGLAIDTAASPNAYVTGSTASTDFPTTSGVFQALRSGGTDGFIAKVDPTVSNGGGFSGGVTGGGGGGCFIATAAYGSPLAADVLVLRELRDRYLVTNAPGQFMVAAYYRLSPPLARLIAEDEMLRATTRGALRPVVWWANLAFTSPTLALLLLGGAVLSGLLAPIIVLRAQRPCRRGFQREGES
ncbi:MAG: SBBP repeat-containing protein, partial [Nitrospirales bacterium]